jgi:hypothetical protein
MTIKMTTTDDNQDDNLYEKTRWQLDDNPDDKQDGNTDYNVADIGRLQHR